MHEFRKGDLVTWKYGPNKKYATGIIEDIFETIVGATYRTSVAKIKITSKYDYNRKTTTIALGNLQLSSLLQPAAIA